MSTNQGIGTALAEEAWRLARESNPAAITVVRAVKIVPPEKAGGVDHPIYASTIAYGYLTDVRGDRQWFVWDEWHDGDTTATPCDDEGEAAVGWLEWLALALDEASDVEDPTAKAAVVALYGAFAGLPDAEAWAVLPFIGVGMEWHVAHEWCRTGLDPVWAYRCATAGYTPEHAAELDLTDRAIVAAVDTLRALRAPAA